MRLIFEKTFLQKFPMTLLFVEGLARCLYRYLRLLCIVTFFESHGHLESESIESCSIQT